MNLGGISGRGVQLLISGLYELTLEPLKKSSKPRKKKEKELEEWLVILFVLGIGLYLIWIGVTSLNFLTAALGAAFAGGSILGTPELRVYVKLTFNYLSRGKSSNITQRDVSDSAVIAGDVDGDV